MADGRIITREELRLGVGALIRIIDTQEKNPIKALLGLKGKNFRLNNGNFLNFSGKVEGVTQEDEYPLFVKSMITYTAEDFPRPILKARVSIAASSI